MPYSGGWAEQPAGLIDKYHEVLYVYNVFHAMHMAQDKQKWIKQHPEKYEAIKKVLEIKKLLKNKESRYVRRSQ